MVVIFCRLTRRKADVAEESGSQESESQSFQRTGMGRDALDVGGKLRGAVDVIRVEAYGDLEPRREARMM